MKKTKIEHERKFLLKELPNDFDTYVKSGVKQWYLNKPDNPISLRIRLYDDGRCYFDSKRGEGISKEKTGEKCNFVDVEKYTIGSYIIEKDRYKKHIDDYLIIIDFFNDGLKLIEIESDNIETVINFNIPDWFGKEVTYDNNYRNKTLAYNKFKEK